MDLKKLDTRAGAETGCTVTINDVAGRPTDIVIRVRGSDSVAYRDKLQEIQRRQRLEGKAAPAGDAMPAAVELCAACTIGWDGLNDDGHMVVCSEATAQRIYAEYPVIHEQVLQAVLERANFLPADVTS
jgi:hypothetical protein